MMDDETTRIQLDTQRQYVEFLDDTNDAGVYAQKVKEMIQKKNIRLVVNINDLRNRFPIRCTELLRNGFEEMPLFMKALKEVVATIDSDYVKDTDEFFIGFEGSFGTKHVTPRSLTSTYLGNMVCVEGIVTKCSIIRPKVVRSVHYCPATKKTMERRYADLTSFDTYPSVNIYPTKDEDGNVLETEYGLSKYRDNQTITIQEMPEKAPTGQLPRSVDVILDNDLVDQCKPGDRVLIVGVFRCLPGKKGGVTSGIFKAVLLANQVTLMSKDANLAITMDDIKECKKFSKIPNCFEVLARSLAPTIHGHEYIKKAVLCLLLGGVEKILANGTRLRGDINVLLIGDPSVAKSQMLRYVANVAPRVVMTTGRGSSGVGLTAAVTTDMESGDRRLEAGAMVLADRGIVCIDEFDKMSDADRTAIHEVMEQGRVTIAKAGIHARLNARTAVLAAANPVYGRYDEYKSPMENIGLQDSLLSRFDLLFIVLDSADPDHDRAIADHVLRIHRYRNPAEQDGEATPLFQNDQTLSTTDIEKDKQENAEPTSVYEKHNELLHGPAGRGRNRKDKILSMNFMKKYIHIAKLVKPTLTSEAATAISEEYARIRSFVTDDSNMARTQPVTARSLETMIRLSTAHAKARMSKLVTKDDALVAIELVQYAYFKKVLEKEKKRRRHHEEEDEDEILHEMDVEGDVDAPSPQNGVDQGVENGEVRRSKRSKKDTPQDSEDPYDTANMDETEREHLEDLRKKSSADDTETMDVDADSQVDLSDDRYKHFRGRLNALSTMERSESITVDQANEFLSNAPHDFTLPEISAGLKRMEKDNTIMVSEGIIFFI